jgi:hypothetical protein
MSWFLRDYMADPLFFGRAFDPVTLGTSLAIGAAGAGGSYALSKTNAAKVPAPPPVQPTPDIFAQQAQAKADAERKRLAALPGSSRETTILSGPEGTGGGAEGRTSYSGTVLGS